MLRDFRFALRSLRRAPGTSGVAVLVLTLGIGANLVVFNLVHGILLQPLDFKEPGRLVRVFGTEGEDSSPSQRVTEEVGVALREGVDAFAGVAAAYNTGLSVTDSERPLNPLMRRISAGYFEVLGASPLLGRTFEPAEHHGARVVVLHYGFWQSHFGGDPEIVGRTIELAYEPYEIVGVMPASYRNSSYPQSPVLWLPLAETVAPDRRRANQVVIARLADGADLERARRQTAAAFADLERQHPADYGGRGLRLAPLHDSLVETLEPMLLTLAVAVGFVLLITSINVANLLLARALGRRREISLRLALGARRGHLVRQMVIESLILSSIGAGLGLLAAVWATEPLKSLTPTNLSVPLLERVGVEPRMALVAVGLALATSLAAGLFPFVHVLRSGRAGLDLGTTRQTGGRRPRRLRAALVVAEIAISMVLLVGAGLMVKSLAALRGLDLGFEPGTTLAGRVGARGPGLETPPQQVEFHRRVLERLAALPSTEAVGMCEFLPMFAGGFGANTSVAPAGSGLDDEARERAVLMSTTPGYFDAFGQPLLRGRDLSWHDTADSTAVAVVSRSLARRLWGDADPVGRELLVGGEGETARRLVIVGMAGDLRGLIEAPEPPPILFVPLTQRPVANITFFIKPRPGAPAPAATAVGDAIWSLSRDVAVYSLIPLDQAVADLEWRPRFLVQLLGAFAVLALILAVTGLYAILAYSVAERTREIGIRVAVGARRRDILRMVEFDALRLSLLGVGAGTGLALLTSRFLESQLFGVSAGDPATYSVLAAGLVAVALAASRMPALRATRVDPVEALRAE